MKAKAHNPLKILVAGATLSAALAGGSYAADAPQVHVNYADINLRTPAGAAVLNRRIAHAAEQVCGFSGDRDLARRAQFNACKTRAVADAVAAVAIANVQLASLK